MNRQIFSIFSVKQGREYDAGREYDITGCLLVAL